MRIISRKRGLTFIELMLASAVGVLVIGASLTLMTNIYKGIAVEKLKTYS